MRINVDLRNPEGQRNLAAALGLLILAGCFASAFPKNLVRYRQVRAAQAELMGLQDTIRNFQQQITADQKEILRLENRIREFQKR